LISWCGRCLLGKDRCGNAELAPSRVRDAPTFAVAGGGGDELGLEVRDVGAGFARFERRLKIEAFPGSDGGA
jgi:hypothetical protein